MPPNAPPASSKKKKGGSVKGESSKKPDRKREAEDKKLADEFAATPFGQRVVRHSAERKAAEAAAAAAEGRIAFATPDIPPCDGCSMPFSGTMQCSRCESVFYCNRDCQVSHWSAGGHKTECRLLKERNEDTAKRVLREFTTRPQGWSDLDVVGAYKAAVHQGLHDKIREVLLRDKAEVVDRFRSGHVLVSYAQCVMWNLFRGHRAEGRADARSPTFTCVDGLRVRGYVRSHPDALDAWLQASVQLIRAVTDPITLRDSFRHNQAHYLAREVWVGWVYTFLSPTAARAILDPFRVSSQGATDAAGGEGYKASAEQRRKRGEDHARRIVKAFGEAIRLVLSFNDDPRIGLDLSDLESKVVHVAAMVLTRTEEYGIRIDYEGLLHLEGERKERFKHLALPMAERIIEKGDGLNPQEANAVMARAALALGYHEQFAENQGRVGRRTDH